MQRSVESMKGSITKVKRGRKFALTIEDLKDTTSKTRHDNAIKIRDLRSS